MKQNMIHLANSFLEVQILTHDDTNLTNKEIKEMAIQMIKDD